MAHNLSNQFQEYLDRRLESNLLRTPSARKFAQRNINNSHTYSIDSSNCELDNGFFESTSQKQESSSRMSKTRTCSVKKKGKISKLNENVCSICLDEILTQCIMPCDHKFCEGCLVGWLTMSSKCPCCRREADYYLKNGTIVIEVQQKEYGEQMQEDQFQLQTDCYVCMSAEEGDTLIICDTCDQNACHLQCDPSLGGRMPRQQDFWECHHCRNQRRR